MKTIEIDRDYLVNTLAQLIRIDSTNPSCTPQGAGEIRIAQAITASLTEIGLEAEVHPLEPNRANAVGVLKGSGGGRSLMLTGHCDTVGVAGMANPFSAEIRNGRMFGRGTQDMKGSLAACMAAAKALVDSGIPLAGDLVIAAVADEEYQSLGIKDLIKRIHVDSAIVTEPSDLHIALAHRGIVWLEVETTGRAAHGSRYQEGIDSILHMGRLLCELDQLEKGLRKRPSHPLVGPPSIHTSRISGGTEWSTYPSQCKLQIERRTLPGENPDQIVGEVQGIIDQLTRQNSAFNATMKVVSIQSPFEISPSAQIVQALQESIQRVMKVEPTQGGVTFWTDAAILAEAGIETTIIGPKGGGLHSPEEWVNLQSLVDLALILAHTAMVYCNRE
jgi:acetylornithine deacetylase